MFKKGTTHERLKTKLRSLRDGFPEGLGLRVHRALSWLNRAESAQHDEDLDSEFIFLLNSFNSAYAYDVDEQYRQNQSDLFSQFFEKTVSLDVNKRLYEVVWSEFSNVIRVLLNNQFVFQPFWDYLNGRFTEAEWRESFDKSKKRAAIGLANNETAVILVIVFRRLYTLRNQLMHGGATWNGSANRAQIRDCAQILRNVLPIMIDLMMDNKNELWADPHYPVIKN